MNSAMKKRNTYPQATLNKFVSRKNSMGLWVIELSVGKYLHYLDHEDIPILVKDIDHAAQTFESREKADGIIIWLKRLWSEDEIEFAPFARH